MLCIKKGKNRVFSSNSSDASNEYDITKGKNEVTGIHKESITNASDAVIESKNCGIVEILK